MNRTHSYDPADGFPRIMPALRYEDVGAAIAWLTAVLGLTEHLRWVSPGDGEIHHAEMRFEQAFVELARATDDAPSPRSSGAATSSLVLLVDDVDQHHARAVAAGARIVADLEDKPWGLRQFTVADPEGHRWELSRQTRKVAPADWGATLAAP